MENSRKGEHVSGKGATLYERGRVAMDASDLDSAITLFRDSAECEPHFKTLELLGECFLRQKRYRDAVIPLAAAVGLGTQPYRSLYLLAQALESSGQHAHAVEKLRMAVEMKPDFRSARELLERLA